jgi:hypothetical protein
MKIYQTILIPQIKEAGILMDNIYDELINEDSSVFLNEQPIVNFLTGMD